MTVKTQAELKAKFETRKVPTYQDFVDLVESLLHAQLGNFPDPLPAVSGKNLKDIGDTLPNPLPARDGKNLYNVNPQEYNIPSGITPSYASANTFVVSGDYTSGAAAIENRIFLAGRRLRLTIAGSYTYTEVLGASYNAGTDITTVTTADNMPGNQLTACAVGIVTPYGQGGAVGPGVVFGISNTINGAINYAAAVEAVAGTDYTGTHSPALSAAALVAGLELRVKFPTANTSLAPRYNPNGLGYKKIFKTGGSALDVGDIIAGGNHCLSYNTALDGGNGGYVLLNPFGIFNASVIESKLAAASVSQSKLKTTTAAGNVDVVINNHASYALVGGTYSWWQCSGPIAKSLGGGSNLAAGVLGFYNSTAGDGTVYVDERYVQASPPYTHGPLFVFLALDTLGKIKHARLAPDPPWAYHGPTDITPEYWRGDKAYRKEVFVDDVLLSTALKNQTLRARFMTGEAKIEQREIEITLTYKDSDMYVMPHYFLGNDLTDLTVVLLEPGTTLMQDLELFCLCGEARKARDLILNDQLVIDNTPIAGLILPPSVMPVRARWKLTP